MTISQLLSTPYAGSVVAPAGVPGFHISLDGIGYQVDQQSNTFAQIMEVVRYEQGETVQGELVGIKKDVWRRYRDSWHYGMGQLKADKDESIPYRYRESHNVDPWERWRFKLINGTKVDNNGGLYTGFSDVVTHGNYAFCYENKTLFRALIIDDQISWSSVALPNRIASIAYDGKFVLAANGPFVHRIYPETMESQLWRDLTVFGGQPTWEWVLNVHGTWQGVFDAYPTWNDLITAEGGGSIAMVRYVKNRVICSMGNILFDLTLPTFDDNGDVQDQFSIIHVDKFSLFEWRDAADGLSCIYVLGGNGERWMVQRLEIQEDGISLKPPITSASLPDGEKGTSITSYMGYVVVGSSKGVRVSFMEQSGDLALGQLIPLKGSVYCGIGRERFIWVGNSRYPTYDGKEYSGLMRLDLSRFTEPLTPAYANDVNVPIPPPAERVAAASVMGVGKVDNRAVFSVTGIGLCIENMTYATEGHLTTGKFSFGSTEAKQGQTVAAHWAPLRGSVTLAVSGDRDEPTTIGSFHMKDSTESGKIPIPAVGRFFESEIIVKLAPTSTGKSSPTIESLDGRATWVPGSTSDWVIPIVLRDTLDVNGASAPRLVGNDYLHLSDLVETAKPVRLRIGAKHWLVHATDMEWRPEEPSRGGTAWQGVFIIKLREVG